MAERRMFAERVVLSDRFIALSKDAQLLYFVLGVVARDKGIVINAKTMAGVFWIPHDAIQELIDNEFLVANEDGTYQIVHWYENNGSGENAKKRLTYSYRKWREAVLERDGHQCQICGSEENLQVHHIQAYANHPSLRLEMSNGITLCRKCHMTLHRKERKNGTDESNSVVFLDRQQDSR